MRRKLAGARVFLTGGTGFIGSRLVRRLLALGARPHLLVRDPRSKKARLWRDDSVILHEGDILDATAMARAVAEAQPDIALSLACVRTGGSDSKADVRAAVILATALKAGAPELQLWVRTGIRLGPGFGLRDEAALEEAIRRRCGLPMTTLRLFAVYGPGQRPRDLISRLIGPAAAKATIGTVPGVATGAKDLIHVDDVVEAYLRAASHPAAAGRTFEIGSGRALTPEDLRMAAGSGDSVLKGASEPVSGMPGGEAADIEPARRYLSWQPRVSLREGLRRLRAEGA